MSISVITSYSIHYTKLYENEAFPKEGVSDQQRVDSARQKVKGDEVFVLVFSEDNSKEDVVASAVCFKRRIITSCGELDILALASVAVRKSMRRITSYNVCYTKLLRSGRR